MAKRKLNPLPRWYFSVLAVVAFLTCGIYIGIIGTEGISIEDVVEIISGPFKGERAKVARVDGAKEELILELLDSPHTIPIRVHADFAKIVEKAHREEEVPSDEETEEGEEEEYSEEDELDDDSFWST